jgi:hypothetical protein
MSKCTTDAGLILIPDWYAFCGYEKEKELIHQGNKECPWVTKLQILFFRGADSGAWDRANWRASPRFKLVTLSQQNPQLIDARLSHLLPYEDTDEIRNLIHNEGFVGEYIPLNKHAKYRYLMDVDGHCAATPRLPALLSSNSVVFKHMTRSQLWFYGKIKPYIHFIPIHEDLSNLLQQLAWAQSHDEECRQISLNAQRFAKETLTPEVAYLYLYRLIQEYSKKQKMNYHL